MTVLTGCSDTGRISQEDDRKTFSVSLWSLHPSPPALPISPLHSLVSSRVGSACASVFFSPGTLSSLSAALHLHNHICVPLVCQVNLLVSGPSINNTLLDSFYFLLSGWWWWCWKGCRIFGYKLFLRKVKREKACGDLVKVSIWIKCRFKDLSSEVFGNPAGKKDDLFFFIFKP